MVLGGADGPPIVKREEVLYITKIQKTVVVPQVQVREQVMDVMLERIVEVPQIQKVQATVEVSQNLFKVELSRPPSWRSHVPLWLCPRLPLELTDACVCQK